MGFKVPQHWGILGAKISIHDRAKYNSSTATVTIDPTADTLTESDETVILTRIPY
jgi:hypothetical protein